MARGPLSALLALAPAILVGVACGRTGLADEQDVAGTSSGGDAGFGGAGSGGLGGHPVTDGAPSVGGTKNDAGDNAIWQSVGDDQGCKFERLTNPEAVQLFEWAPCKGVPDCEKASFPSWVFKEGGSKKTFNALMHNARVHDDGEVERLTIESYGTWPETLWVADAGGRALDGFRLAKGSASKCMIGGTALWARRLSIDFFTPGNLTDVLFARIGDPDAFAIADLNEYSTEPSAMGETRWAYGSGLQIRTVSNISGLDKQVVASFEYMTGILNGLNSAGQHFLFESWPETPGLNPSEIHITDGLNETEPYLTPPSGSWYLEPMYANSHVFWLRGLNKDLPSEKYESIEVWASPYTPDPTSLAPEKLGEIQSQYPAALVAGWGRYAVWVTKSSIEIWNAQTKQKKLHDYGAYGSYHEAMGLTRKHFWLLTDIDDDNGGDYMLRFTVDQD